MKEFKGLFLSIIVVAVLMATYTAYLNQETKTAKQRVAKKHAELLNMDIPPKLNERMRSPSWDIKHWIGADQLQFGCRESHEYMNEGVLEKNTGVNGSGTTFTIFYYLSGCKESSKRVSKWINPYAKKWCHFRDMDPKFDSLCQEWNSKGQEYLDKMDAEYLAAINRFNSITNGSYEKQISQL